MTTGSSNQPSNEAAQGMSQQVHNVCRVFVRHPGWAWRNAKPNFVRVATPKKLAGQSGADSDRQRFQKLVTASGTGGINVAPGLVSRLTPNL
jgi:hypothetical protein